jgi:tellurite resistance protein
MVMGLAGLSIAWSRAERHFALPWRLSEGLLVLAILTFALLTVLYLFKTVRFPGAVRAELASPIQINFFPTASLSALLLGISLMPILPRTAGILWVFGAGLQLLLTLYVVGVWLHHEHFQIQHINPAWFIPAVGNALVPIAGVTLGFVELSWFYFSIAMILWLLLFAIIFYRVLFHHPLPERLMPTFFILIAPPSVGFVAYVQLAGGIDAFARVLYYVGLFLALLLLTQAGRFVRIRFYLTWWAYSFPLAAIANASLIMHEQTGLAAFAAIGWVLLTLATLVVVYLLYRTAKAASEKGICLPVS